MMEVIFKKLTMVEAILYAKEGEKVKLPEWGDNHYLYSDGEQLIEKYEDAEKVISSIPGPWKVRQDWMPIQVNDE